MYHTHVVMDKIASGKIYDIALFKPIGVFGELQSHDFPNYSLETFMHSITLSTWKVQ